MESKWPEKQIQNLPYNEGWNACPDACTKSLEGQRVPLKWKKLKGFLLWGDIKRPGDTEGDAEAEAKAICARFTPPQRAVPSVEEILFVLRGMKELELKYESDAKQIAQAIRELLEKEQGP